jgi:2,3-bisphosphoglycerate-dependent phosphoglycerate mutase
MTHLYLIRHARSTWNALGRMQGQADPPLDELGVRQAQALGERFRDLEIEAVYSSPLVRAYSTAEAIAGPHRLTIQRDDRLMELHMGEWTGLTGDEANERYPGREMSTKWRLLGAPGGETYAQLMARAAAAIDDILAAQPDKRVAVVSHGGLLNAYLLHLLGLAAESPIHFHSANTAIHHVIIKQGEVHILSLGDDRHLEGLKESV